MSIVPQSPASTDPSPADPIGRRPVLKTMLAALVPWGDVTRAGAIPAVTPTTPLPSAAADDRPEPGGRCYRVVHDVYEQYPAPEPLDQVIGAALEDHENRQAWRAEHGMRPSAEDLAVWDRGRLAAAILFRDGNPDVARFAYPEPGTRGVGAFGLYLPRKCSGRITYTVAVAAHELYRSSRLGLTLDRVIADEVEDLRDELARCAAGGLESPAEDRTIWEDGVLVAAVIHRPEAPIVVRFFEDEDEPESKGGAR
jgi:hypothetical protein